MVVWPERPQIQVDYRFPLCISDMNSVKALKNAMFPNYRLEIVRVFSTL